MYGATTTSPGSIAAERLDRVVDDPGGADVGLVADPHAAQRLRRRRLEGVDHREHDPGHAAEVRRERRHRRRRLLGTEARRWLEGRPPPPLGGAPVDLLPVGTGAARRSAATSSADSSKTSVGRGERPRCGEPPTGLEQGAPEQAGRPLVGQRAVLVPQPVGEAGVLDDLVEGRPVRLRDLLAQGGDRVVGAIVADVVAGDGRGADGGEQHVGELVEAPVLEVVAGGEAPAVVLEVLVEPLLRGGHGVDLVDRADAWRDRRRRRGGRRPPPPSWRAGSRVAGDAATSARKRDSRSRPQSSRCTIRSPSGPHVGHVEPEVQRRALHQPLVDLLDVVGERGVVETGQVDRAGREVRGDQRRLPLVLPARQLRSPALRLEGLLGAALLRAGAWGAGGTRARAAASAAAGGRGRPRPAARGAGRTCRAPTAAPSS